MQLKIAETIAFAFAFLFHEVNSTCTPKSTNQFNIRDFPSPQEKAKRQNLFAQSLKSLTIFLVNVVHYSDQMAALHKQQKPQTAASAALSYLTSGGS